VASKAKQLNDKDELIEQKDVDMAYYEKEMYKYSDELNAEVASKVLQLKDKDADIAYYEKEMHKYMTLFDSEVASNILQLKQKDIDMAYYAKEMHKYMTLFDTEVASKAKQLKQKDADIAYYEKLLAYADDHLKATIDAKIEEIDYYRRRGNAIDQIPINIDF
jgi:hypothetical protein